MPVLIQTLGTVCNVKKCRGGKLGRDTIIVATGGLCGVRHQKQHIVTAIPNCPHQHKQN